MKLSVRARRMQRNHKKLSQTSKLSLVSLMDIFTILVFFLMVNSSEVQVLQKDNNLALPESTSKQTAKENLVITVTREHLLLQGRKLTSVDAIESLLTGTVKELSAELDYQKNKLTSLTGKLPEDGLSINILADKTIPYEILKKIMKTAATAGYGNISLAVAQVELNSSDIAITEQDQSALEVNE